MTALAINTQGCVPSECRCLLHDEDLVCSHHCDEGDGHHAGDVCDDPSPAPFVCSHESLCIGCGKPIAVGELVTAWEEGYAHYSRCPDAAEREAKMLADAKRWAH